MKGETFFLLAAQGRHLFKHSLSQRLLYRGHGFSLLRSNAADDNYMSE